MFLCFTRLRLQNHFVMFMIPSIITLAFICVFWNRLTLRSVVSGSSSLIKADYIAIDRTKGKTNKADVDVVPVLQTNDYVKFMYKGVEYAMKLELTDLGGSVVAPQNYTKFFQLFPYSRFLRCNQSIVNEYFDMFPKQRRKNSQLDIDNLVRVRNVLFQLGYPAVLQGGSLLGWYRECRVIPHTNDFDVLVPMKFLSRNVAKDALRLAEELACTPGNGRIKAYGLPECSYEISVRSDAKTDVYILYDNTDPSKPYAHYISNVIFDKVSDKPYQELRETFPSIEEYCSVDLLGFLFHVPCNVEEMLQTSYGKTEWFAPKKDYTYKSSPKNLDRNRKYTEEEMKRMDGYFKCPGEGNTWWW